jgi:flavodoxin I
MNALVVYWSATGNTEKIASVIERTLREEGVETRSVKLPVEDDINVLDYDIVFLGSPSYQFLPPDPMLQWVRGRMKFHNERSDIKPCSPRLPGKTGVTFCTYSGPHTGIAEAIPVGKVLGQLLDHLGFELRGEWYTIGEFHGNERFSTRGRCGNIVGHPNDDDLAEIAGKVRDLLTSLK